MREKGNKDTKKGQSEGFLGEEFARGLLLCYSRLVRIEPDRHSQTNNVGNCVFEDGRPCPLMKTEYDSDTAFAELGNHHVERV